MSRRIFACHAHLPARFEHSWGSASAQTVECSVTTSSFGTAVCLDGAGIPGSWPMLRSKTAVLSASARSRERQTRDRRDWQVRLARLDRYAGPVRRRTAAKWVGQEQIADGRDDRDRRRIRYAGAGDKLSEYFATLEKNGISMNFGTSYSETQARVAVLGEDGPRPDARGTRQDGNAGRNCHEGGSASASPPL